MRVKVDPEDESDEEPDDAPADDASTGPQAEENRATSSSDSLMFSRLTLYNDVEWDPPLEYEDPIWYDVMPVDSWHAEAIFGDSNGEQPPPDEQIQVDEPASFVPPVALSAPEALGNDTGIQTEVPTVLSQPAETTPSRVMLNTGTVVVP